MKTKCLKATIDNIQLCANAIKNGKVVAFPTETVYGLGASIFSTEAIAKIFSLKNRPHDNPLITHIHNIECVLKIAKEVPEDFYKLAEVFFPGPLTVVLPVNENIPKIVTANKKTIAIRMPKNQFALKLIEYAETPIVAPSANLSGMPSSTSALHVKEDFDDKIPYILDGGECEIGIESTVVLLDKNPYILRPGAISTEEIENCLNKKVNQFKSQHYGYSPGMKYKHYAPNADVHLVDKFEKTENNFKNSLILSASVIKDFKTHLLTRKNLYDLFRYADRYKYQEVIIINSDLLQKDKALMHRIKKAVKRK